MKLYSSINISEYSFSLQQSLDNLTEWSNHWQLAINVEKCAVLSIGKNANSNLYRINNVVLKNVDNMHDLGIDVDSNLFFHKHINCIVTKARQRLGVLYRGFVTRNPNFMRKSYITYIRPLLEYNSVVWNPYQVKYKNLIERVQRNFTRWIPALHDLPYSERLALLNLETLECRRLKFDLTLYYKIFHGLVAIDSANHFNYYSAILSPRNTSPKLIKPVKGTTNYFNCFFNRSIDCYNSLPHNVKHCTSLLLFKKNLLTPLILLHI